MKPVIFCCTYCSKWIELSVKNKDGFFVCGECGEATPHKMTPVAHQKRVLGAPPQLQGLEIAHIHKMLETAAKEGWLGSYTNGVYSEAGRWAAVSGQHSILFNNEKQAMLWLAGYTKDLFEGGKTINSKGIRNELRRMLKEDLGNMPNHLLILQHCFDLMEWKFKLGKLTRSKTRERIERKERQAKLKSSGE